MHDKGNASECRLFQYWNTNTHICRCLLQTWAAKSQTSEQLQEYFCSQSPKLYMLALLELKPAPPPKFQHSDLKLTCATPGANMGVTSCCCLLTTAWRAGLTVYKFVYSRARTSMTDREHWWRRYVRLMITWYRNSSKHSQKLTSSLSSTGLFLKVWIRLYSAVLISCHS